MKRMLSCILFAVVLALAFGGCVHHAKQDKAMNMEMKSFDAHFPDMDTNGDKLVNWGEFKNQFSDSDKDVFEVIDINKDGNIDHDEWHDSKATQGSKMHKSE